MRSLTPNHSGQPERAERLHGIAVRNATDVTLKRIVDEETIRDIYAYTLVSLVFFMVATIFVVVDASRVRLTVAEFEAMSAAAATFFNVGPAFGIAGPLESYAPFPRSTKLVMTFLMWIGRIEIIPVLVLLTPPYWRS